MEIFLRNINMSRNGNYELIPNINNSSRILPPTVNADEFKDNRLDSDSPNSRKLSDKEIYPLIIQISKEENSIYKKLRLEIYFDDELFTVLSQSKIPLIKNSGHSKKDNSTTTDLLSMELINPFDTKSEGITFYIECKSFKKSPLLNNESLRDLRCFITHNGKVIKQFPEYNSSIIPCELFLIGDDAPAERLYICDVNENKPSIEEVSAVLKKINVPMTIVPIDVNLGDTWIQDQFQFAFAVNNASQYPIILHLPRMVNDSALYHAAPNLKNFVENYFPSNTHSLFNDFWKILIPITDNSTSFNFKVTQTYIIYKRLNNVIRLLKKLISLASAQDPSIARKYMNFSYSNIFLVRTEVESLSELLLKNGKVSVDDKVGIRKSITIINNWLNFVKNTQVVQLTIHIQDDNKNNQTFNFNFSKLNQSNLNDFFKRIHQIHSSLGYGGNIEISPAWQNFKFGKVITGSLIFKELENFISVNSPKQPVCKVFTEWLEVGHIDEIMGFVKNKNTSSGFSIARAAPQLARNLLKEIIKYKNEKKYLVTRLFRGKKWNHEVSPTGDLQHLPPNTFKKYIELAKSKYDLSGFEKKFSNDVQDTFFDSAYHDDRKFIVLNVQKKIKTKYAAFISCEDILEITEVTNSRIENMFLTGGDVYYDPDIYDGNYLSDYYRENIFPYRLDKVLQAEFPQSNIINLPVLFDYTANLILNQTKAIIPDCVNFQTVNGHILMPRPYGPRMKTKEAIVFIKDFFAKNKLQSSALSQLNERYIADLELNKVFHWTNNSKERKEPNEIKPTDIPYGFEAVSTAHPSSILSEFDSEEMFETSIIEFINDFYSEYPSGYLKKNPVTNHPIKLEEDLRLIATYFKDGFDEFKNYPVNFCAGDTSQSHPKLDSFEQNIKKVEDAIRKANIGKFDGNGKLIATGWSKIIIPEDTVDIFELYIQLVLASADVKIHWVDSWYYHTHSGGIHCGTNVLRNPKYLQK